ncbi:MAG: MBOAT family protein [Oscillospiraceae bacterium]|nr:MBOAT family protein [Oscillospiraceae bacterium]
MLFSSLPFLFFFLPVVLAVYYLLLRKNRPLQNVFLFLASLFFYAWGEPRFVLVLMLSIAVNWMAGLAIVRFGRRTRLARFLVALDVIFNLSFLFVYKYLGFMGRVFTRLSGCELSLPALALPIGISFFTFQAISYVVDIYRGKGEAQKNILSVGLYISFFPQLIAGPIVRYETVAAEIQGRRESAEDFFSGFSRFVEGLAKKVLLANKLAILADTVFGAAADGAPLSVLFSWLGAAAYALQLFFDFSGYSDMAIGLGRMFGFHFLENFNYPYISTSISEFWRRWHMSLGTWFRDYVFIPLGGSRVSRKRLLLNLFIVWVLTGLWHGANYTYIVWGLLYFVLLVFERFTGFDKKRKDSLRALRWAYTMFFVILGHVIFRSDSIGAAACMLRSMFALNGNAFSDGMFTGYFAQNVRLMIIGCLLSTPLFKRIGERCAGSAVYAFARAGLLFGLFVLSVASLVSNAYNPFIYFNF